MRAFNYASNITFLKRHHVNLLSLEFPAKKKRRRESLRRIEIAPLKVVDFNFTEREPSVTLRTCEPPKCHLPVLRSSVCACTCACVTLYTLCTFHTYGHGVISKKAYTILMNNAAGRKFVPSSKLRLKLRQHF